MQKIWNIKDRETSAKMPVVDRLLKIRGINSEKKKQDFLEPLKMNFVSPYAFVQMEKAIERIRQAIENQEKIVIWGDFDADGVTSTCLMYKTLKLLNANVDYYIPSRQNENHGLNSQAIIKFLTQKTKLFITVDCASTNTKEISLIKSFKSDIIVTDHHDTDVEIPDVYALINPKAPNNLDEKLSIEEIEYLTNLAGVGVAFKLALALLEKYDKKAFTKELLPLVALGSIADIVPLIGENRAFVKMGLDYIKQGVNKGITQLLKSINYNYEINSECIAFYVAPRINASGRLDTAQVAFNLLYETDEEKLKQYCETLNQYNLERQNLCDKVFEEAQNLIQQNEKFEDEPAIVLYNENWHVGIIGIVAAKLVETYYKPTFLMCKKDELVACSSRGIEETDIHEIITNIYDYLESGGGHKMAGGFAFNPQKTTFETIKEQINDTVKEMIGDIKLTPKINIDIELTANDINLELCEELKVLEPFGTSNPVPLFCCNDVKLCNAKLMGQNNNHLKLYCQKDDNNFDCVFWNKENIPKPKNNLMNLVFTLKENEFNKDKKVQLDLKDMQFEEVNKIKVLDQRDKENICEILDEYCKNNADKIKIYAYQPKTLDNISKYAYLSSNILTKAQQTPQLVFLDYPKSLDKMKIVTEKTQPQIVHFTKSSIKTYNTEDYFKTLTGLLKYCLNNKAGELNITDLSNYFTYDEKLIKLSLKLLEDINLLKIENGKVLSLNPMIISKLQENENYKTIEKFLDENNKFLNDLMYSSIEKITELLTFDVA